MKTEILKYGRVLMISCCMLFLASSPISAQVDTLNSSHQPLKRPGLAALEVTLINLLINRYDAWFFRDGGEYWARVSPQSWKINLERGLEWDWNSFGTNWFGHPVHGSMLFNAPRSMGLSYWESAPYSFLGSMTWEYLGETHPPSGNDLLTTSLGGIYLGEITHRLSDRLVDYPASGPGRIWRLTLATVINPMRLFNRWINGEPLFRQPEVYKTDFRTHLGIGHNFQIDNINLQTKGSGPFIEFEMFYGNPYERRYFYKPFESFKVTAWLRFVKDDIRPYPFMNVTSSGLLWGRNVLYNDRHIGLLGAFQHFDYHHDEVIEIGSLGFSAGWLSRHQLGPKWKAFLDIHLGPSALGGSNNEVVGEFTEDPESKRDYILGPGFIVKGSFDLEHDHLGRSSVNFHHFTFYVVSGPDGVEKLNLLTFRHSIEIWRGHRFGVDYTRYFRRVKYNDYAEYQNFMKDLYELRAFVTYEF